MRHQFSILSTPLTTPLMHGFRFLLGSAILYLLLMPAWAAENQVTIRNAIKDAQERAQAQERIRDEAAKELRNDRAESEKNRNALNELLRFQRGQGGINPTESRNAIAKALDRAQGEVDEFGTLYLSSPTLTRAGSNEFRFDLSRGASNYFTEAKTNVNGRAAAFDQSANTFRMNIRAQLDPANAAAYGADVAEFTRQLSDWRDRQAALRKAADLDLEADLAAAVTNTSLSASNAAVSAAHRRYATNIYSASTPPTAPSSSNHDAALADLAKIFEGDLTKEALI